ncbi:MAG TPA: helix-turn-helix domain-containing protein [Dehalococcoidia bacterium]|nr:helix-turn-helix domain-containing protein [Dehalococcoidia bacterium]
MPEEPLISISEASQMLGVSEVTLRQWTDEGKIKAFITPGGHRRYSRAELKKFLGSHPKVLGIKDLVAKLEETAQQHREIARASLKNALWYHKLNAEAQEHLAELGRRLLSLIIKYITEPSKREEVVQLIRDIGHEHGEMLAKLELPLTDSVEAFLLHRSPILNATTQLMKRREILTGRVVEAISLVAQVLDEALVALVAAHQQHAVRLREEEWKEETPGDISDALAL